MRRSIAIILSIAMAVVAIPTGVNGATSDDSKATSELIYVDGIRYHLHSVVKGDTLYSISKRYGVSVSDIIAANPKATDGLSIGMNLKIKSEQSENKSMSDKKLRKIFDQHIVSKGETIYSISKQHEISVEMILEDNPALNPASISVGSRINIRKSGQGSSNITDITEELHQYQTKLNKVAPEGLIYHIVEDGETIESVATRFDMETSYLEEINKLSAGESIASGAILLVNDIDGEGENRDRAKVGFEPLSQSDTLEISLLLPLSIRGYALRPMVEFYQGFLLGVEDLKRGGRNVIVNLFNTERNAECVNQIIDEPNYQSSDLVVGPIYEELLPAVLSDAERRHIPVVSPLATLKEESSNNPVLFQMAPDQALRYKKIEDMFIREDDEDVVATMIYGERNDEEYAKMIEDFMIEQGMEYRAPIDSLKVDSLSVDSVEIDSLTTESLFAEYLTDDDSAEMLVDTLAMDSVDLAQRRLRIYERFYYKYEHPSVISDRKKESEELTKLALQEARLIIKSNDSLKSLKIAGCDSLIIPVDTMAIIDSLKAKPSPSDLTPLISRDSVTNIFFVLSNDETEVDRILSALASAYTAKAASLRGSGRRASDVYRFCVVSNPAWRQYKNIDRAIYFRDRVVDLPTYLARRDSEVIREFDSRYGREFSDFPSLYSYRGYDAARIFGEGMFGDIEFGMMGENYTPLQSTYRFDRSNENERWTNTNWMRVKYNINYTITID